jgi:hypothetical protein
MNGLMMGYPLTLTHILEFRAESIQPGRSPANPRMDQSTGIKNYKLPTIEGMEAVE